MTDSTEGEFNLDFNDDHLIDASLDELGRSSVASDLARYLLEKAESTSSTVTGIVGPWGSGKSTFAHFVEAKLNLELDVDVVFFNPWAEAKSGNLTWPFFRSILRGINTPKGSKEKLGLTRLSELLLEYQDEIELLDNVLLGKFAGGAPSKYTLGKAKKRFSQDSIFAQISKSLQNMEKPIFVFVDDVDRLNGQELLETFQLVRAIGRLPNLHFLLVYDKTHVRKELSDFVLDPDDYLSKMIQLEIPLSEVEVDVWQRYVSGKLVNWALARNLAGMVRANKWWSVLGSVIFENVNTPRKVKRLLFALDHFDGTNDLKIDVLDLACLESVRNSHSDLWDALVRDRKYITFGGASSLLITIEQRRSKVVALRQQFENKISILDGLLSEVFEFNPAQNTGYPSRDQIEALRLARRVSHSSVFESYLMRTDNAELASMDVADEIIALRGDFGAIKQAIQGLEPKTKKYVYSIISSKGASIVAPDSFVLGAAMVECLPSFEQNDVGLLDQNAPKLSLRRFFNALSDEKYDSDRMKQQIQGSIAATNLLSAKWFILDCVSGVAATEKLGQGFVDAARKSIISEFVTRGPMAIDDEFSFFAMLRFAKLQGEAVDHFLNRTGFLQALKTATYTSTGTNGSEKGLYWQEILEVFTDQDQILTFVNELLKSQNREDVDLGALAFAFATGTRRGFAFGD